MPFEAFRPQPQPPEAPQPATSLWMEQVVTQLAVTHNIDLSQKGATLMLDIPAQKHRWLIGNIDGQRVGVSRLKVDHESCLVPELDMIFELKSQGWEPVEIVHTPAIWQAYANAAEAQSLAPHQGDFDFGRFADHWAQQLEQQAASTQVA